MCTPSEFYSCQILSDCVPLKTRSTRDRSTVHPTQLAKMSFDKILDLTAVVYDPLSY